MHNLQADVEVPGVHGSPAKLSGRVIAADLIAQFHTMAVLTEE